MKESTLNPVAEALLRLIPNGNPDSLFKGYAAFAMIPELKKMTSWHYDHAAFRDDAFRAKIEEKLDIVFSTSFFVGDDRYKKDFDLLKETFEHMSVKMFLQCYMPGYVAQLDSAYACLDAHEFFPTEMCSALLAAKRRAANPPVSFMAEDDWRAFVDAVNCYVPSCPVIKEYYAKNPHAGFFSCEESGCVLLRACKANCG